MMRVIPFADSADFRSASMAFLLGGAVPSVMVRPGWWLSVWLEGLTGRSGPIFVAYSTWPYLLAPLILFVSAAFLVGWLLGDRRTVGFALAGLLAFAVPAILVADSLSDVLVFPGIATVLGASAMVLGSRLMRRA